MGDMITFNIDTSSGRTGFDCPDYHVRKEILANGDIALRKIADDPRVRALKLIPQKADSEAKVFFYQGEFEWKKGGRQYTTEGPRVPIENPYYANHGFWFDRRDRTRKHACD